MPSTRRRAWSRMALLVAGVVTAVVATPPPTSAQGTTGTIEGRVSEHGTNRPVPNAQVVIAGTSIGAATNETGTFRITGAPARQVELRVRVLGFSPVAKTVVVTAGQVVRA